MPEPDAPEGQTDPVVPESANPPALNTVRNVRPIAPLVEAEAVGPAEQPASESKPEAQPTVSKFEAAVVSVAEERTSVATGEGKRAKPRKETRRKPPVPVPAKQTAPPQHQPQMAKAKDRRIMANLPSFQKADLPDLVADVQDKAIAAFEKSTEIAGKVGEVVKGSADAVVTSSKILGAGFKEIGASSVADSRKAIVTFGDDLKEFAAIKTPSELLRFQGKLAGRNLDAAFALASKNGQTLRDLVSKAWAPLSRRSETKVEATSKS